MYTASICTWSRLLLANPLGNHFSGLPTWACLPICHNDPAAGHVEGERSNEINMARVQAQDSGIAWRALRWFVTPWVLELESECGF